MEDSLWEAVCYTHNPPSLRHTHTLTEEHIGTEPLIVYAQWVSKMAVF